MGQESPARARKVWTRLPAWATPIQGKGKQRPLAWGELRPARDDDVSRSPVHEAGRPGHGCRRGA
jgi:hypothetical protein